MCCSYCGRAGLRDRRGRSRRGRAGLRGCRGEGRRSGRRVRLG